MNKRIPFVPLMVAVLLLIGMIMLPLNIQQVDAIQISSPTNTSVPTATPDPTATPVPTAIPAPDIVVSGPATGSWQHQQTDGTAIEIPMNQIVLPAPEWMQLMTSGIQTSGGMKICHPYRGAAYGWSASIFLKNGNSWLELPSTIKWVPDQEGQLMICAQTWVAGTYTVFGYWEKPEDWNPLPKSGIDPA